MSLGDTLVLVLQFVSWTSHAAYTHRLRRLPDVHIRGHGSAIASASLVSLAQAALQCEPAIHKFLNGKQDILDYISISTTCLHLCYLMLLIPSKRHTPSFSLNVQDISNSNEYQSLLGNTRETNSFEIDQIEAEASFISRLFFWWVLPLLKRGAAVPLANESDMLKLPDKLCVEKNERLLHRILYNEEVENTKHLEIVTSKKPIKSLFYSLHRAFGLQYYAIGLIRLVSVLLSFAGPLVLNRLVTFMIDDKEAHWHGYIYASVLFACSLISSLCDIHFDFKCQVISMKMRSALVTAVYGSVICAESALSVTRASGRTLNAMSTDIGRLLGFLPSFHFFWSLPLQLIVSLVLLYQQIGVSSLSGVVVMVLMTPINKVIANKIAALSEVMMKHKDNRIRMMTELLNGIRVIKMHSWEAFFHNKINIFRELELKALKSTKYIDALCVYFWACTPMLISISSFTSYVLLGNKLTAAKVFTSIALFDMLIFPLNALPWVVNGLMEAKVSLFRVQNVLGNARASADTFYSKGNKDSDELVMSNAEFTWYDEMQYDNEDECKDDPKDNAKDDANQANNDDDDVIIIQPGCNSTTNSPRGSTSSIDSPVSGLHNINITIKKNSFVGIIGKVGSGKTSLLNSFLSEMKLVTGTVHSDIAFNDTKSEDGVLRDGFGFTSQEVWLQNTSIRENILFGSVYDSKRYHDVLHACDMVEDINIFPSGDKTEIGEKGVTLSGGQKMRISLARAIYQDKEIYLLDDPLASVDVHVARRLVERCLIGDAALLAGKTRVLATHHTRWLARADMVIRMKNGRIVHAGTPEEVLTSDEMANQNPGEQMTPTLDDKDSRKEINIPKTIVKDNLEDKECGVVDSKVYKAYWRSVGIILAPLILLSLFLAEASVVSSDLWLSYWVSHVAKMAKPSGSDTNFTSSISSHVHDNNDNDLFSIFMPQQGYQLMRQQYSTSTETSRPLTPTTNSTTFHDNTLTYLGIYASIVGANTLFTLARAFLFAHGGVRAAVNVHRLLIAKILKAPISFFDITPVGRILNRFSADLYAIDDSLPFILNILLAAIFGLMGSIAVTVYGLPWIIVLIIPLSAIYYKLQSFYRKTSREVKRIQSITLSPIISHFSETMAGLSTIRALRRSQRFRQENRDRISTNQRAEYSSQSAAAWLNVWLQLIAVIMVTSIAMLAVFERRYHVLNPGLVGIALTYAISMSWSLSSCVNTFAETEKNMVAMERAKQYIENVPEETQNYRFTTPYDWPTKGLIVFKNVSVRYRPDLPNALQSVNLFISGGEKIGIVGRTGSGKSSMFQCLLRIVDPLTSGNISIDGLNIADISLNDLRSKVAIIPQDPFLFKDSIRSNLDPEVRHSNHEVLQSLDKCGLTEINSDFKNLDTILDTTKLSVGERQLFCLARALLDKAKILLIDEATASVDSATDRRLQAAVRSRFEGRTVLTIAHRPDTVLGCDRVVVMRRGEIAECGSPDALLTNPRSLFSALLRGDSADQTSTNDLDDLDEDRRRM